MITPENNGLDHELLAKYLAGETTIAESEKIDAWLAESDENWEEFERLSKIWNADANVPPPNFDSKKAWEKVEAQITSEDVNSDGSRGWLTHYLLPVAAAVIGIIAITSVYQEFFGKDEVEMLSAQTEENTMELTLADGSTVHLNANSKLEYPAKFSGTERNVTLTGEAFFEVERDTSKQFQIEAEGSLVTVLGTSFNVKTGEELVEVTVETGKVALEAAKNPIQRLELVAGERGVYEKTKQQVVPSVMKDADHLFWMNRQLNFNETSLAQVVLDLNENYGTEISLSSSSLEDCKVSATFENQDVTEVIEVLISTFDLELDTVENRLILSGSGCENP